MRILLATDVTIFEILDTLQYFDLDLNQIKKPSGLFESIMGSYGKEASIIEELRKTRGVLAKHDGDEVAARKECCVSSFDVFEECLLALDAQKLNKPFVSKYPYHVSGEDFDFWLRIYKGLGRSRSMQLYVDPDTKFFFDNFDKQFDNLAKFNELAKKDGYVTTVRSGNIEASPSIDLFSGKKDTVKADKSKNK